MNRRTSKSTNQREIERLKRLLIEKDAKIMSLKTAIERALADDESGNGWGPDVTVCSYLRAALNA